MISFATYYCTVHNISYTRGLEEKNILNDTGNTTVICAQLSSFLIIALAMVCRWAMITITHNRRTKANDVKPTIC